MGFHRPLAKGWAINISLLRIKLKHFHLYYPNVQIIMNKLELLIHINFCLGVVLAVPFN
jgi:hypothetical protein